MIETNVIYYGDNLEILRKYIPEESIDLIYLDPPWKSDRPYNILFKEPTGKLSEAQIAVFDDTWHWTRESEETFEEIVEKAPSDVIEVMKAFRSFIGRNDVMAYLTMMCIRLLEMKRVLKNTGSIYLHCNPVIGHYVKILMDAIFRKENFRNEIVWQETHIGTTDKFGLLNIVIGEGSSTLVGTALIFKDINWTADKYFVKVRADFGDENFVNGMVDLGTTPLQSVPYALVAARAEEAPIPNLSDGL